MFSIRAVLSRGSEPNLLMVVLIIYFLLWNWIVFNWCINVHGKVTLWVYNKATS